MAVSQWKLAWLTPNLGILWISVSSFRPCESIVANPIIYRLVPRPSRFETRQYRNRTTCMLRKRKSRDSFCMVIMVNSVDYSCVCPTMKNNDEVIQHSGHAPTNRLTETYSLVSLDLPHTSLILDVHVMINWYLSNPGICWPVSHDHIMGSGLELIKVLCSPLTSLATGFSTGLQPQGRLIIVREVLLLSLAKFIY